MEIIIVILGFFIDRVFKIWASLNLKSGNSVVIIKNIFDFTYLENRGAAWGILQNKQILLSIITSIILIGIICYLVKYKPKNKFLRISLSLILAGAIGNLFDRVYYSFVVDFIHVHYAEVYNFPTFNIADSFVVIGTIMLAIYVLKEG